MKLSPLKIVLLITLVLIAIAAVNNLHQVERTINEGPSTAVLQNDFYAAGKFLAAKGHEVIHRSRTVAIDELPPQGTLILTDTSTLTSQSYAQALMLWVYHGGNLIWEYSETDEQQPLADLSGITASYFESEAQEPSGLLEEFVEKQINIKETDTLTPKEKVRVRIKKQERTSAENQLSALYLPGMPDALTLRFRSPLSLSHPAFEDEARSPRFNGDLLAQAETASHLNLIQLAIGTGTMTVVSDASIWDNDQIGLFDHAYSLWRLTSDNPTVYIQRYADWPGLLDLLQMYAAEAALSILLLLLCWLLYNGLRFGPIRILALQQRRSLQEHIGAVGQFHYRHKHHNHLLKALRNQIYRKANTANPDGLHALDTNQHELIAHLSSLPLEQVERALSEQDEYNDAELFDIIQLLIKIRNAL